MKKILLILVLFSGLMACNENGTVNEEKIDAAGDKLQNTVEKTTDSIGSKVGRWADSLHHDKDTVY